MRLLIKQRVFSWSDTYDVYDEEGNAKYFIENFIKTIPSREKILNYHFELWEEYIKSLNKKQQKELKKKIQIIKAYKDDLADASVIRFQNVTNLLNFKNINYNIK